VCQEIWYVNYSETYDVADQYIRLKITTDWYSCDLQ